MSATCEIIESNGAGEEMTVIGNLNLGSADVPNLVALNYRISPGENSYEKWIRLRVTDMGGSTRVRNIKIWREGGITGRLSCKTNARSADYAPTAYQTPVKTASVVAIDELPNSEPVTANIGINGALDGRLTEPGYSDYIVLQLQSSGLDRTSGLLNIFISYEEE